MSKRLGDGSRGPLAGDATGFGAELTRLGYSGSAAKKQLRLLDRLSVWLDDEGLDVGDVSTELVEPFFEARREAGTANLLTRRALVPLVGYLCRIGRLSDTQPVPASGPVEQLVGDYRVYLIRERGLVEGTVAGYLRVARAFLAEQVADGVVDFAALSVGKVTDFAARSCSHLV